MGWVPQKGDTVVDRSGITYVLDRPIGEGGQGVVFTTEAEGVAVKISNTGTLDAKKIEDRIASVMRLPVHDLPVALPRSMLAGTSGYAMTMLTGMSSVADLSLSIAASFDERWYVESGGIRKRLAVIEALGDVVNRLHTRGLVYGDLSANNVLVSTSPDKCRLFLIDLDNLQTTEHEPRRIFTSPFAAPEQREHGATIATDRFSLAVIAFAVLTGSNPFYGDALDPLSPDELVSQPFALRAPYIDDPNDGSNRFAHVIERSLVISPAMNRILDTTFTAGRFDPTLRADPNAIGMAALRARHLLTHCSNCGWDNYLPHRNTCASCAEPLHCQAVRIDVLEGDAWIPHASCPMAVVDDAETSLSTRELGLGGSLGTDGLNINTSDGSLIVRCDHPDLRRATTSQPPRSQPPAVVIERQKMAPLCLSLTSLGATA